jgi:hypothetical protein
VEVGQRRSPAARLCAARAASTRSRVGEGMDDLSKLSPSALSAAMRGGINGWGQCASSERHVRYAEPVDSRSRRRCHCGCNRRASHRCMANGMSLGSGCELWVARWVRNPQDAIRSRRPSQSDSN